MSKKLVGITLLLMVTTSLLPLFPVAGSLATLSVQPRTIKVWGRDELFTVNVTVADVTNLYGWQIKLCYDSSILNGTGVSEGSFLKSGGDTYFNSTLDDDYNVTHGRITCFGTLIGKIPGVNGTGVLFTITFKTRSLGISPLDFEDTILADVNSNKMPHTAVGGGVRVVKSVRDVAIENVSASSNMVVEGQIVEIYVTAANLGNKTETFHVTSYYNETVIGEQIVEELPRKADIALTFLWDTTPITPNATCIIKAEASQVPEETNLENNVLVNGTVKVVHGVHDVAVVDVTPSSNMACQGEILNIYVTVENEGDYIETFNVTVYRDDIVIGVKTVENITYGYMLDLTFPWDTAGLEVNQTYRLKAAASTVGGEIDLEDNTLTDGNVTIYPPGLLSIEIVEVVPCNQLGEPLTSFPVGTMANFRVTVNCTLFAAKTILLTINLYDAAGNTIGVVSFQGPVGSGLTTFAPGVPIPTTAKLGTATVYANVLSDWPHLGGTPYCPEVSATFEIRGSQT